MPTLYYTDYTNPDVTQQRLVATFLNIQLPSQQIPNKHAPMYLVDGTMVLNQPNAISFYLSNGSKLVGSGFQQQIEVYSWLEYFNLQIYPLIKQIYGQIFGKLPLNQKRYNYANEELKRVLKVLDDRLRSRSFIVGDSISLADIIISSQLFKSFRLVISADARKKLVNLTRWFTYLTSLKPFVTCVGKAFLCENAFQLNLDQKEDQTNTQSVKQQKVVQSSHKGKQQKQNKKKQQGHKKQQAHKKQNQKKQKEQGENTQEIKPEIEGQFNLDTFKRNFQNSDNKSAVIDQMLSNLGPGWSIWKIYYSKDVTQGKVDYLTSNLAKGTLQRLEGLRKTGFGSWGVYFSTETQQYQIRGVMLWKGEELATAWKEHPSHQYHIFQKLDPKSPQHQKIIKDYWLQNETCQGLTYHTSFRLI